MSADLLEPDLAEPPAEPGDVPPTLYDLRAEQSVLGACLLKPAAMLEAQDILTGEGDFYRPAHGLIWEALVRLSERGEPIDAVTVARELNDAGELARSGGPVYLHTLLESVPSAANVGHYARIVADRARSYRAWIEARSAVAKFSTPGALAVDVADEVTKALSDAVAGRVRDQGVFLGAAVGDLMEELDGEAPEEPEGVLWPYRDDQGLLTPMLPGQMIVIAARTSIGKSTVALDILRGAARQGKRGILFTLEMSVSEVAKRFVSAEAGIPLRRLQRGKMNSRDWEAYAHHLQRLEDCEIVVDDHSGANPVYIRQECTRHKARRGLDVAVVDYMQLMSSGRRAESRQQEVSEFSRALKLLAKELDIPIVAVAQLNRNPEQRQDKKPQLGDLRESGSIENDADTVVLLHRPDFYEPESPRAGEADLIFAKHRNGPLGTLTVAHQLYLCRLVDMARED